MNWQVCEGPTVGTFTRARAFSLPTLSTAATARIRRRAIDPPPPRLLLPDPSTPPRCTEAGAATVASTYGYKHRASARLIRRRASAWLTRCRASILLRAPRSTSDHVLLEPTCNMAHPRCLTKFSQGMRRHRRANIFCYIFLFTTSSSEVILCMFVEFIIRFIGQGVQYRGGREHLHTIGMSHH
jgi:hypothetical protein